MSTQKKFEHKGKTYYANQKGDKISITTEKTATGQIIHLGCYYINTNSWQYNTRNNIIPNIVKRGVELAFGTTNT